MRPEPEKRSPKKTTNLVDKSRPFQRVDRLTQRRDPTNALDLARRQLKQATLLNHSLPLDKVTKKLFCHIFWVFGKIQQIVYYFWRFYVVPQPSFVGEFQKWNIFKMRCGKNKDFFLE